VFRGGGGGGGADRSSSSVRGLGGNGGGGNGAITSDVASAGSPGVANTGGGGGGGNAAYGAGEGVGGNGGSGIVVLRYPKDYQITIGAGLTGTSGVIGDNSVAIITAGAGNVSWVIA
jgi:hypothetical protein